MHAPNSIPRRTVLSLFAIALMSLVGICSAQAAGPDINADPSGLALHGYDPVAYFTEGKPVKGKTDITAEYDSATYRFATAANLAMFQSDPGKYAPQYGGYCAYGTALGKKFDGDPNVWKVVDGKLYLNVNPKVSKLWGKDIPGFIEKADANWPQIKDKTAAEVN
jgi:YHS domain-containing protein